MIVGVFLVLTLTICVVQSLSKSDPDAYILYAGQCYLPEESVKEMERIFETVMEDDLNGDGEKRAQLRDMVLLSGDKQATALHNKREEDKDGSYLYAGNAAENESTFFEEVGYGKTVICLIDEAYYEKVRDKGRLASLEELYGSLPENALDKYGIRIHDTAFGRYFALLRELPDDTVLCIKCPTIMNQKKKKGDETGILSRADDDYLSQVELLKRILTFDLEPQGSGDGEER